MIKDYLRCSIRNRLTLVGHALVLIPSFGMATGALSEAGIPNVISLIPVLVGMNLLAPTLFGYHTYDVYRRVSRNIKKYGRLDRRIVELCDKAYCSQVGMELAAEDHGLEDCLK